MPCRSLLAHSFVVTILLVSLVQALHNITVPSLDPQLRSVGLGTTLGLALAERKKLVGMIRWWKAGRILPDVRVDTITLRNWVHPYLCSLKVQLST